MVKGPQGFGLKINPNVKGVYLIITGGTGVIPYLDFLYFLLKKFVIEFLHEKDEELAKSFNKIEENYDEMFVAG